MNILPITHNCKKILETSYLQLTAPENLSRYQYQEIVKHVWRKIKKKDYFYLEEIDDDFYFLGFTPMVDVHRVNLWLEEKEEKYGVKTIHFRVFTEV